MSGFMKRSFALLMLCFLVGALLVVITSSATAADIYSWNWESPLPQGNNLTQVATLDANHIWAVGEYGTIIFSDGVQWELQQSNTTDVLYGVSACDATHVWAVGDLGTIHFYNGSSWSSQVSGTDVLLNGVYVLDATHVWAVGAHAEGGGGTILFYDGSTWTPQTSNASQDLNAVYAFDATHVWAVGNEGTIRFFNGTTWDPQDSHVSEALHGVSGFSATQVWAVGSNDLSPGAEAVVVHTGDGTTWAAQTSNAPSKVFESVWALDATHVYGSVDDGANGEIYLYDGTNWGSQWTGQHMLLGVSGCNADTIYTVGLYGEIFKKDESSSDWLSQLNGTTEQVNGLYMQSASNGWAAGESGTLMAYDGTSWSGQVSPTGADLDGVWGSDATHAWAVADSGEILRYAGTDWTLDTSQTTDALNAISGVDGTHIWAVGDNGTIRFCNGGTTWVIQICPGVTGRFWGVYAASATNVWAVGESGLVAHFNGTDWSQVDIGVTETLYAVSGYDASHIWAVGDGGRIALYNGTDWATETSPTGQILFGVCAVDASHIWAVGLGGTVLLRDTGGWSRISMTTGAVLTPVSAVNAADVWVGGTAGTILHGVRSAVIPLISAVTTQFAPPGTTITVTGTGFGADPGAHSANYVRFGTFVPAESDYVSWSDTSIQVKVPAAAYYQADLLVHTAGGGDSNSIVFYVQAYISTVSPTWGNAGYTTATLTGFGFGPSRGTNSVWFDGSKAATYTSWNDNQVKVTVGAGAQGQSHVKVMVMGCFSNAKAFDVRAIINSITPTSGPSGTTLVISGSAYCNSQGSECVFFGSKQVTSVVSWKQTQIKVKVPSGISGTVQVKVYTTGGMSNYKNFTKT